MLSASTASLAVLETMESEDEATLATVDIAHDEFGALIKLLGTADWARPTPCDEWNVSDLVDHVTGAARIYRAILDGRPFEEAMSVGSGTNEPPADRLEVFRSAAERLRVCYDSPEVFRSSFAVPGGNVSGAGLLTVRIFDVTVHCWDLARAIGAPEVFPVSIVDHAWKNAVSHYKNEQRDAADLTPTLEALIALTGRTP